jgi:processive 1,2-diacylglycerol beta-glucosyltransferase
MTQLILDTRRESGCDYHRIQLPMKHLTGVTPKVPTLYINRDTSWSLAKLRAFKADGGRFIYDQDDTIHLPAGHPLAKQYANPAVQDRLRALLSLADVVTVTTTRLAQEFRHMTRAPIEVLPNALPFDRDQFTRSPGVTADRPIVWAGGMSHEVDLALVRDIIDGRQIALAGYQRTAPWFNMVQMFPGCRVKPALPVRQYMQHYDGHQFAIAPLAASPFAECKSNLKILEAGAKGLPIICSRTPPYWMGRRIPGVTFARDESDWRHRTLIMRNNPQQCAEQGDALAAWVRENYHLDTVNEHRRQILEG